ncbi:amidase [Actinomadura terrae]|uniref:amidase n=1 Tax=Actinomadura terrae TaxID=604353 RepID=UPI001FA7C97E|nr:amidase [Actinomadura terrae]
MDEILDAPIRELRARYADGAVSPAEVVEMALDRVARDPLSAIAHVRADEARAEAARASERHAAGAPLGPLDGVPVAVKAMIAIAGMPQDAGSRVLAGAIAPEDASVVAALRRAGAVIVASTTQDEFALTTLGPARNPFDPARTAGGSSGGSAAAVRAGMCFAALGTDTGGSVRIPAACCAVVGLKPTYGLLPTEGIVPLAWSLDHAGPIGRTVADVALTLDALLAGSGDTGSGDPAHLPGRRIGVPTDDYLSVVDPHLCDDFTTALGAARAAGAELVTVDLPDQEDVKAVHWPVLSAEMAAYHRRRFGEPDDRYGTAMRDGILAGAGVKTADYLAAQRGRLVLRSRLDEILTGVDAIALPTMAIDPPPLGRTEVDLAGAPEDAVAAMVRLTSLANHTGHPAVSVPVGTVAPGRPSGVQLIAPHYGERDLLSLAAALEALRN